jgi:hypothetical protein
MQAVTVQSLEKDLTAALRHAEQEPLVIMEGDEPSALLLHLDASTLDTTPGLRTALAAALFSDGALSLGAAARIAGLSIQDFLRHLAELGIDVVGPDETTALETASIDQWLSSSSPTQAR